MVCETLGVPMAVLGTITESQYFPEGMYSPFYCYFYYFFNSFISAASTGGFVPMLRETALCNYTIKKGQTFVIPDIKGSNVSPLLFSSSMPLLLSPSPATFQRIFREISRVFRPNARSHRTGTGLLRRGTLVYF